MYVLRGLQYRLGNIFLVESVVEANFSIIPFFVVGDYDDLKLSATDPIGFTSSNRAVISKPGISLISITSIIAMDR